MTIALAGKKSFFKTFKTLGIALFAFVVVFQPPLPISVIYIISVFSLFWILFFSGIKKRVFPIFAIFLVILIFLFISLFINGAPLSNMSTPFWIVFAVFPAAIVFSDMSKRMNFDSIFRILVIVSLFQAFISLLSFFNSSFNSFLYDLMIRNGLYTQEHMETFGYRIYGYGTSLMYSIPIVQSMISAWCLIRGILNKRFRYYFFSLLIIFSSIINAKISLFVFAVVIVCSLIFCKELRGKKTFAALLIVSLFATLFYVALYFIGSYNRQLYYWFSILFDKELLDKWYLSYYSDSSRLVFPDSWRLLIGAGGYTRNLGFYVDMGFINDAWLGGTIYLMLSFAIVVFLSIKIFKSSKIKKPWNAIMAISFFAVFIIADIKGIAFSYSAFFALFMAIAFL